MILTENHGPSVVHLFDVWIAAEDSSWTSLFFVPIVGLQANANLHYEKLIISDYNENYDHYNLS